MTSSCAGDRRVDGPVPEADVRTARSCVAAVNRGHELPKPDESEGALRLGRVGRPLLGDGVDGCRPEAVLRRSHLDAAKRPFACAS